MEIEWIILAEERFFLIHKFNKIVIKMNSNNQKKALLLKFSISLKYSTEQNYHKYG